MLEAQNNFQYSLFLNRRLGTRLPLPESTRWSASPHLAAVLVELIERHRPKSIVELGSGTSTIVIGYLLEKLPGSTLYTIEHSEQYAHQTSGELDRHGLENINLFVAPLRSTSIGGGSYLWYDWESVRTKLPDKIDLLLVDGPPRNIGKLARYPAMATMNALLSEDAIIVVDDSASPAMKETIQRWMAEFPGLDYKETGSKRGVAILRRTFIADEVDQQRDKQT